MVRLYECRLICIQVFAAIAFSACSLAATADDLADAKLVLANRVSVVTSVEEWEADRKSVV